MAAAVPAAWPMAIVWAMERTEACASCVAREAAPGHQRVHRVAHDERAVGDAHDLAVGQVLPARVGARMVVLDGRAAEAHLVVEAASAQHVVAGQAVVAVDAARLADADLRRERHERGLLVAGHAVAQEARVLEGLAAAAHLGLRRAAPGRWR